MPDPGQFPFTTTGSYPARPGNALHLLIDGEPAFRRICEAIGAAQDRVWATITFMWPEFQMPDGLGNALEVLDLAARRGVDVRLLFWRPDDETASLRRRAFWGAPEDIELLNTLRPRVSLRWDRAHPGFCQHQKTWLIDAGEDRQTAFIGSLNLNPHSLVSPGHAPGGQNHISQNHDVCVELSGPCVADVHHNFVQRWNEASERSAADGGWGERWGEDLAFPVRLSAARTQAEHGLATVQIQRTTHAGRYRDGHPTVHGRAFHIVSGERTNLEQYISAIGAARRTIYLEHQSVDVPEIVEALHAALRRGVKVLLLLPAVPDLSAGPDDAPERTAFLAAWAALGASSRFALCGLAGLGSDGRRTPVHIHSKLMIIDDLWATIGSANLHRFSLFGNGELNATILSPDTVRAFRVALFAEHLGLDTSEMDDLSAFQRFREMAGTNSERHRAGNADWQGLVHRLAPSVSERVPDTNSYTAQRD